MKAFKKRAVLVFTLLTIFHFAEAQFTITGPTCVLPFTRYTYYINGTYPQGITYASYAVGGSVVGYGPNYVEVIWQGLGDYVTTYLVLNNTNYYVSSPFSFGTLSLTGYTISGNKISGVTAAFSDGVHTTCGLTFKWTDAGSGSSFNNVVGTGENLTLTNLNTSEVTLRREVKAPDNTQNVWYSPVMGLQAKVCGVGQDAGTLAPSPGSMVGAIGAPAWYESTDGTNWTALQVASPTYNPGILNATKFYRAQVITKDAIGNSVYNQTIIRIEVVAPLDAGIIVGPPPVKAGQLPGNIVSQQPASGCGTPAYQWEKSDDGVNFTPVPNATGETYSPGVATADTWYRRKATCSVSGYSNVVVCNVIAPPAGGTASLGKGIADYPNTSVIPLVNNGTSFETKYSTATNQSYYTIKNVLALQVLEETGTYIPGDFTASVQVHLEYGHSNNTTGLCSKDVTLSVNYKKDAGVKYDALNYLQFEDAEYTRVTVTNVQAPTTVNGVAFDTKDVLKLTNTLASTRYYQLADNKKPVLNINTPVPLSTDPLDALGVNWTVPANTNNNGVQLEWAWAEDGIDDEYKTSSGDIDATLVLNAGATRIDLAEGAAGGSYNVPLLYEGKGTLCMRIRAVNVMPSGSRSDGPWSDPLKFAYQGHGTDLNWQATTSYAEEGKRKSVIQYFDGTLRPRQTVTKDNTTGQTVVAETLYDMEGRAAVQVLPVPGINNIIAYTKNLNQFNGQAPNTNPADYFDFTTSTSGYYGTTAMDPGKPGAANYFSTSNTDPNTDLRNNLPAANGYPYSVTRYMPDATGRVMRQSGPGDAHKMGGNHETLYFYGTPEQEELDALFGTEVGYKSHYFKNMVQDANGQMTVSYLDMQGRTIATALAGESTQQDLPSKVPNPYESNIRSLLSGETNILKGNSIESVNSLLVPYSTDYKFVYKLNKQTITLPACDGSTVTYDCKFDWQIAVVDETGEHAPYGQSFTAVTDVDFNQTYQLPVGSWNVRKTLTINQDWLQQLIAQYSAGGVGVCSTLDQLTSTITADDVSNSKCNVPAVPVTSSDCLATIGDFETYKNNYAASINVAKGSLTEAQVSDIKTQYDAAVAFCTSLNPEVSSSLANIRQQMLADMTPNTGQYADPDKAGFRFNIFAQSGSALPQPYYRHPQNESPATNDYYNGYGSIDASITATNLQGMTPAVFAQEFQPSWANALIKYHPEYNKLKYAEDNLRDEFNFVDKLQVNATAYNPIPDDPFFKRPEQSDNANKIANYVYPENAANGLRLWQIAYGDAFGCKTLMDPSQKDNCYTHMPGGFTATGTVVNDGVNNVTLTDAMQSQAWLVYKGLYLQLRNEMVNGYINESGGGDVNSELITGGYMLHFPKDLTEAAQSNGNASNTNEWAGMIPDAQGNFPNIDFTAAAAQYSHPCDSYIEAWRNALLDCPQLAQRADKDDILNTIITRMQEVCRNGTDAANPYGASSVAPAYSGNTNTSFEQVILQVFHDKSIVVSELCHPYGIEMPKPYGMNPPVTKQTVSSVESCTCSQWNKIVLEMYQANTPPTSLAVINQFLTSTNRENITPELYAGLLKCGQAYQVCTGDGGTDPCPSCRTTASNPGSGQTCVTISSIPLISPQPLPAYLVCGYDKSITSCYNCAAFVNLQASFTTLFGVEPVMTGDVPADMVGWNNLFAQYVNYKTGLQHNWIYYAGQFNTNKCPIGGIVADPDLSDLSICRDNLPLNDATGGTQPDPCDGVNTGAKLKATIQYSYLRKQAMDNFNAAYLQKCLAATETFTLEYQPKEYHYTLYYYDQAGNLVKTVPPKGVQPNYTQSYLDDVKAQRDKMKNGLAYIPNTPDHTLYTRYIYNSLDKVVVQKSPDAGISMSWYDQVGRQAAVQDAKQAAAGNVYSYTQYDEFSRVVKTSQLTSATQLTDATAKDATALDAWFTNPGNSQSQIRETVYDKEYGSIDGYIFNQENLRNRVSYSKVWNNKGDQYAASATYYTYDVHGNVDALLQDFGNSSGVPNFMNQNGNRFKKIVYDYDLISGKVNQVNYQPGEYDAYYHRYRYDDENRITDVFSGRDEIMLNYFPEREAQYDYYKHGSLASITLGQLMVQKQDYVYTINGWLKGVNPAFGGTLANGTNTAELSPVAQDVYGFSLHYFDNDYNPIGYTPRSKYLLGELGSSAVQLYNGNIAALGVNIPKLGATSKVYNYHYDQLNRLVAMDTYNGLDVSAGTFMPGSPLADYKERISYDPNGNILTYLRNGDAARPAMDDLTYNYTATTNQLDKVTDQALDASATDYSKYNDIKKFQADHNYKYDLIGNLTSDDAEGITGITWDSYGKMTSLTKGSATTNFMYDPSGNRIIKVTPSDATAYVRDADGNVLSVYSQPAGGNLAQTEVHLYGSQRLGMVTTHLVQDVTVVLSCGFNNGIQRTFTRGEKLFELSNQLDNVLATVTDKKIAFPEAGTTDIDHYEADLASAQDYYPFGMLQPGRKWNAGGYRYGFNGKENDNDVKGEGNQQDYGMRIYDPRLGKFLSVDPLTKEFPFYTPYQFAGNKPIYALDLDGKEELPYFEKNESSTFVDHLGNAPYNAIVGVWNGIASTWNSGVKYTKTLGNQGPMVLVDQVNEEIGDAVHDAYNGFKSIKASDWKNPDNYWSAVEDFGTFLLTRKFSQVFKENVKIGNTTASKISQTKNEVIKELKPCGCFTDTTLILTKDGYKEISKIKKGNLVWAYNDTTKKSSWKIVKQVFVTDWDQLYLIYAKGTVIETTNEHPFYISGKWKRAFEIKKGDSLTTKESNVLLIDSVRIKEGTYKVYNLLIDKFHTFYVSRKNVLVHNGKPCPVAFQQMGGMFGTDWPQKKIHANVIFDNVRTEISFRLSLDGNSIKPVLAFHNLKNKVALKVLKYGEEFLQNPKNRAKLLELSRKALTTQYVTPADVKELNRMIEILTPQQR